ncbi:hypothetical protein BJP39_11815 [Streptomyces sp. CC77]|nr:hypothetical protein BJP39_11815 [Streptomyces sp. CC77]
MERHTAVGAYALGVLEPYDALCCAEHVARCDPCALRLVELGEVASALAQLTGRAPLDPPASHRARPAPAERGGRGGGGGEEGAAEEGEGRPSGDAEAQPGGRVGEVEESSGGDVRTEGCHQGNQEPAPGEPGRAVVAQSSPGGDQEQVDGDGIGPCLPSGLSGSGCEVVQVGEGQGPGDHGLHQDGVDAERAGHVFTSFAGRFGHGGGRELARGGRADRCAGRVSGGGGCLGRGRDLDE